MFVIFSILYMFCSSGDSITPQQPEVTETEGQSVTLTCSYETSVSYIELHWYRHHSDLQAPQFILWKRARGSTTQYIPDKRYDSETASSSTNLTITALTLADTALYYCRLKVEVEYWFGLVSSKMSLWGLFGLRMESSSTPSPTASFWKTPSSSSGTGRSLHPSRKT
uniref:Ig-like domain-containing protein n=1 Tax=Maylandia zebra TaxID=106582 RepID=A0A3P9D9C2_9CICH